MIELAQVAEPAAVVAPQPAAPQPAVVSRSDATDLVQSRDLPITLTKAGRREDALLRQNVFVASVITVVRPPEAVGAEQDRYRWTFKTYEQRRLCVTSITGLFMCAEPEVLALPDAAEGEAPMEPDGGFPLAEAARLRITDDLKARATTLFETARTTQVQPLLRAAGVVATR
jgi:hypothetical protein